MKIHEQIGKGSIKDLDIIQYSHVLCLCGPHQQELPVVQILEGQLVAELGTSTVKRNSNHYS